MSIRRFRFVTGLLAIAVLALVAQRAWAIYYALGPSKDEWGLKYDVDVEDAGSDMVTVKFTLIDEGRLKPVHSVSLSVLDKQRSSQASRLHRVKGRLELKPTSDGKRVGQIQIRKEEVDLATLQVLTQRVDGKFQSAGAAYFDIPLAKHLNAADSPAVAAPLPPASGRVKR
jgi:hypothetical protein